MTVNAQQGWPIEKGVLISSGGERVGRIGRTYFDNRTGRPSWVTVRTGWLSASHSFVPLVDAVVHGSQVTVPYDRQTIRDAPTHGPRQPLEKAEEAQLFRYYGSARLQQDVPGNRSGVGTHLAAHEFGSPDVPAAIDLDDLTGDLEDQHTRYGSSPAPDDRA